MHVKDETDESFLLPNKAFKSLDCISTSYVHTPYMYFNCPYSCKYFSIFGSSEGSGVGAVG